jgi:hypothetical protein
MQTIIHTLSKNALSLMSAEFRSQRVHFKADKLKVCKVSTKANYV